MIRYLKITISCIYFSLGWGREIFVKEMSPLTRNLLLFYVDDQES